jgi:hypothetical protein
MVTAVLVLPMAACVHPVDSGSASGSPSSEVSSKPPTEPATGTEAPVSPTNGPVAISMAPAPTGNNGTDGACVRVSWLGNPIPSGDIVAITSVIVETPFTFDPAATVNCGDPSCASYQFSSANDSGQTCYVGVGYTKGSVDPDGNDTEGHLQLSGHLRCPSKVSPTACQHDASSMQRPGIGTVRFNVQVIDTTSSPASPPPGSSSSSPGSPSSSPPVSDSSSPVAPGSP